MSTFITAKIREKSQKMEIKKENYFRQKKKREWQCKYNFKTPKNFCKCSKNRKLLKFRKDVHKI